MKKIIIAVVIVAAFVIGFFAGRVNAIYNVELIDYNQNEYAIAFNGRVHEYSFNND